MKAMLKIIGLLVVLACVNSASVKKSGFLGWIFNSAEEVEAPANCTTNGTQPVNGTIVTAVTPVQQIQVAEPTPIAIALNNTAQPIKMPEFAAVPTVASVAATPINTAPVNTTPDNSPSADKNCQSLTVERPDANSVSINAESSSDQDDHSKTVTKTGINRCEQTTNTSPQADYSAYESTIRNFLKNNAELKDIFNKPTENCSTQNINNCAAFCEGAQVQYCEQTTSIIPEQLFRCRCGGRMSFWHFNNGQVNIVCPENNLNLCAVFLAKRKLIIDHLATMHKSQISKILKELNLEGKDKETLTDIDTYETLLKLEGILGKHKGCNSYSESLSLHGNKKEVDKVLKKIDFLSANAKLEKLEKQAQDYNNALFFDKVIGKELDKYESESRNADGLIGKACN